MHHNNQDTNTEIIPKQYTKIHSNEKEYRRIGSIQRESTKCEKGGPFLDFLKPPLPFRPPSARLLFFAPPNSIFLISLLQLRTGERRKAREISKEREENLPEVNEVEIESLGKMLKINAYESGTKSKTLEIERELGSKR